MWAALRSDLKEFVSTVAEDTSTVLTKMDANLDDNEYDDDEQQEEGSDEQQTTSKAGNDKEEEEGNENELGTPLLLSNNTANTIAKMSPPPPSHHSNQVFVDTDGNVIAGSGAFASTGIIASPADEAARLACHEETYLEPLQVTTDEEFAEVKDFLCKFDIDSKTEEISQLLQEHWEIQQHFENLVPTLVKYEDFWQRYYFRCNEERIAKQWQMEQEQTRLARAAAFGGLLSVRSLLGGALSSVMSSGTTTTRESQEQQDEGEEEGEGEDRRHHAPASTSTFAGLNLFGTGGRPPFVMNTAVDESFDDQPKTPANNGENEEEEEVEEEELGWDDEEEEEDDQGANGGGNDDDDESDQVEQIEFKDDEKEQLQKLLAQAISERDQLHDTVELQRNEIATLKLTGVGTQDLELLKMQLFETNAELAALKASLEDTHDDISTPHKKEAAKVALQERELERLSNELSERECELLELKQQLRKTKVDLEEQAAELLSTKAALEEARAINAELQSKQTTLEQAVLEAQAAAQQEANKSAELQSKQTTLEQAVLEAQAAAQEEANKSASSFKLVATEQELQVAQSLIQQLQGRVEELTSKLDSNQKAAELQQQQLESSAQAEKAMIKSNVDVEAMAPPPAKDEPPAVIEDEGVIASPDSSTSTTVKVALPPPPTDVIPPAIRAPGATTRGANNEEDDWGDDWGEDDEN
jgi:hypothetical protein